MLAQGTTEETTIEAIAIIANTNSYNVLLGMDFLGPCFGYIDPLTEEFVWRVDCHVTHQMPTKVARIPACCRTQSNMAKRHMFMLSLVDNPTDLLDAELGEEGAEETFDEVMEVAEMNPAPIHACRNTSSAVLPLQTSLTPSSALHRKLEAGARPDAATDKDIPLRTPRRKWIGGANHGAIPIATTVRKLDANAKENGLHVVDLFSGFSCGGLRTVLEAGYKVACYTTVEIDDISRIMANKTISDLQEEYPGQLPDKAVRGHN